MQGSKDSSIGASGPKYPSDCSTWALKPHDLSPWTRATLITATTTITIPTITTILIDITTITNVTTIINFSIIFKEIRMVSATEPEAFDPTRPSPLLVAICSLVSGLGFKV